MASLLGEKKHELPINDVLNTQSPGIQGKFSEQQISYGWSKLCTETLGASDSSNITNNTPNIFRNWFYLFHKLLVSSNVFFLNMFGLLYMFLCVQRSPNDVPMR